MESESKNRSQTAKMAGKMLVWSMFLWLLVIFLSNKDFEITEIMWQNDMEL